MDVGCILTAHPDDESMFFLPTITSLLDRRIAVHLICVTSGNADGKGKIRIQELSNLSNHLGLASCTILDDEAFPDSMQSEWDGVRLQKSVLFHLNNLNVTTIYTFDEYGVSGHPNHKTLGKMVSLFKDKFQVYRLKSHSMLWKYSVVAKLFTLSGNDVKRTFSLPLVLGIRHAFQCMRFHGSQLVWFRYLYILFLCYSNKNEYI